MKFWPFSRAEQKSATLAEPTPELLALFGAMPTAAGVQVTPRTAVRCTPVAAAVRVISESIGSLPVHIYRRGNDDERERDSDHPAHALLHHRANPWTSAQEFRQQLTADALLHGNGYALVVRVAGEPRELHRLEPGAVSIDLNAVEPTYRVSDGKGGTATYGWHDVLHVRAPISFDGVTGQSPVTLAKEAIGLAIALETAAAQLFSNGGTPSGVISVPEQLSPEAAERLRDAWRAANGGENRRGTAVLESGANWQAIRMTNTDAEYNATRVFAIGEIARAFGTPPHILYEMSRATWSNVESLGIEFKTFGLLPWVRRWEGAIERTLIDGDEHYAEFLLDGFLRADFEARADGYQKLISSRVLSPNEARAREGLPPYEGGSKFENPNTTPAKTEGNPADE
jgi:HK97 family phage portal protein